MAPVTVLLEDRARVLPKGRTAGFLRWRSVALREDERERSEQ
jgi:hypothetical protein